MRQAKYGAKDGAKDGAKNDDNNGAKNGVWRLRVEISAFGGCILRVKKKDDKMVVRMVVRMVRDACASKYPPKADASLSAKKGWLYLFFKVQIYSI